jgi:ribose transport system permease protein
MKLKQFIEKKTIWVLLIAVVIIGTIASPRFLTVGNIFNIMRQAVALSFVSIGQTYAIVANAVDLSVGSLISLSACASSQIMNGNASGILPAILIVAGVVVAVGVFNGYAVAKRKGNPFIVTLGTMAILQGIVLTFTNEQPVGSSPRVFRYFADGYIGPVPLPVIIGLIFFIAFEILLKRTKFGRYVLAVGGNEEVARLAGIPVVRIKTLSYIISGAGAALSGLFLAARMNVGDPIVGTAYNLDSVAVVIIGGANISGGSGSVMATLGGVLLFSILSNLMNITNVSPFYQIVIKGLVIVFAVTVEQIRKLRE